MPLPTDLLEVARSLVADARRSGASDRRATSTAYYALFHALAEQVATVLAGRPTRGTEVWARAYRAFDHRAAREACRDLTRAKNGPERTRRVAEVFVTLQEWRHRADYDSDFDATEGYARRAVALAEIAMDELAGLRRTELRGLVVVVLIRRR